MSMITAIEKKNVGRPSKVKIEATKEISAAARKIEIVSKAFHELERVDTAWQKQCRVIDTAEDDLTETEKNLADLNANLATLDERKANELTKLENIVKIRRAKFNEVNDSEKPFIEEFRQALAQARDWFRGLLQETKTRQRAIIRDQVAEVLEAEVSTSLELIDLSPKLKRFHRLGPEHLDRDAGPDQLLSDYEGLSEKFERLKQIVLESPELIDPETELEPEPEPQRQCLNLGRQPLPTLPALVVTREIRVGDTCLYPGADPTPYLGRKEMEIFRQNGAIMTANDWKAKQARSVAGN